MKRTDSVGILKNNAKYIDLFKRVWCNDMEWIHLAQESAECSKLRNRGCVKSRGSATGWTVPGSIPGKSRDITFLPSLHPAQSPVKLIP